MTPCRTLLLALAVTLLASGGCTDRELTPIAEEPPPPFDNKLKLAGKVCTADPADLEFPLKVLFIIDTSQSMNVNDPQRTTPEPLFGETTVVDPTQSTGRSRSMRQVIDQFIELGVAYPPVYCNTGESGCNRGSTTCAACTAPLGAAICVGADCCTNPPCASTVPICPSPGNTNGVCLPLCDAATPGCGPGENNCADCPNPGDRCINGVCSRQLDPGVQFAIERFGSAKQVITRDPNGQPGFTDDPQELVTALPQVNNGGSVTDYEGALSEAFQLLSHDMSEMRKSNAAALNRSKYVVIFLSDGQPDPRINDSEDWSGIPQELRSELLGDQSQFFETFNEYNLPANILRRVQEILSLRTIYGIGEIALHTAYLTNTNTAAFVQDQAIALLEQMAQVGDGTFRNFRNGEEINFLHVDFSSLRRVFQLKSLVASNLNGRPTPTSTITDSDGDGLHDELEREVGTNVSALDTDLDGFSDTVEHFFRSSGADALDPADADCNPAASDLDGDGEPDDSDGDGLHDCEERFLGTSKDLFDSDADGMPDNIEVLFGTNPVFDDTLDDLDFDGMPNGDELRLHTDPRVDDAAHRSRTSYRYDVQRVGSGIEAVPLACVDDSGCPQSRDCIDGYCRCVDAFDCSSLTTCAGDGECPLRGERCLDARCTSAQSCETRTDIAGDELICIEPRNITCYDYEVENISLVAPEGVDENGWNTVHLYFAQTPFDNPKDVGVFAMACIRARFNADNGAKLPSTGQLQVPQSAWKSPRSFDLQTDCLCPDGDLGTCPAP